MRTTLARLKEKKGDEGFTLIELLIVIIILAILATIVIFAVGTTTKNAAFASCESTVKSVQTALEAYKAQTPTGTYPAALATLAKAVKIGTTTKGPWLKSAPHTTTQNKYGWAMTAYNKTTGAITVTTKTGGAHTTTSPTLCKGA